MEILKTEFPDHQYILSTHAPEIIRASSPATLTMVRWENPISVIEQLDAGSVNDVQTTLSEVGAKLSDVFGADRILWVEGATEEECIPLMLNQLMTPPIYDTSVIGVTNTGDFEAKKYDAKNIWKIYEKLSKSNALIPPAVAFIFDEEGKSDQIRTDLIRASKGLAHFIPRRMFENYLLDPEALHAVIFSNEIDSAEPVSVEKISDWMKSNGVAAKYFPKKSSTKFGNAEWYKRVHGANLLADLVGDLTLNTVSYVKTEHSVNLAQWLITNKPDSFSEIKALLENIFRNQ